MTAGEASYEDLPRMDCVPKAGLLKFLSDPERAKDDLEFLKILQLVQRPYMDRAIFVDSSEFIEFGSSSRRFFEVRETSHDPKRRDFR